MTHRLRSLDAFRGLTVAAMILVNSPGAEEHGYWMLRHAGANGWWPADVIFPAFLVIAGVAIPLAFAAQLAHGASRRDLRAKLWRRTRIIFGLGLLLNALPWFDWDVLRIPGVLQRIALCYGAAALLVLYLDARRQALVAAALLVGYAALLAWAPVPGGSAGVLDPGADLGAWLDRALMHGHLLHGSWDPEGLLSTLPAIATTLLGAHAVPPEYAGRADAYVDLVCDAMIPAAIGLADAVDAFCEGIGFTPDQTARVLAAARAAGLPVKLHAEQLSALHGASLAAAHGALSADHLEHADEADVRAMAAAGTVAVLLPGAFYFMRETHLPPVDLLRAHHVPIAIATDCNPGTSPTTSLLLMLNMAATLFRLTVTEGLRGVTVNAAAALGLAREIGTLEPGKACDLAIWNITDPAELVYRIGFNPLHQRVKDGRCC